MIDDERTGAVKRILYDYVKSPSLKHIRDPYSIAKLAQEIVKRLDRGNVVWTKWTEHRDMVAKSAVGCWIPTPDLKMFLNAMPGPALTMTDVDQRMKDFELESHSWTKSNKHNGGRRVKKRRRHESRAFCRGPIANGPRSENRNTGIAGRTGEPIDCHQRPIRNETCIVSMPSTMTRTGI